MTFRPGASLTVFPHQDNFCFCIPVQGQLPLNRSARAWHACHRAAWSVYSLSQRAACGQHGIGNRTGPKMICGASALWLLSTTARLGAPGFGRQRLEQGDRCAGRVGGSLRRMEQMLGFHIEHFNCRAACADSETVGSRCVRRDLPKEALGSRCGGE